ncbi:MAG: glutamate--tRNA ligase [Candidatus Omnitrophota bacterium]|nr:MAG: glutamate--tRNA ligase [Candidatus Omnitrophota bacterium]
MTKSTIKVRFAPSPTGYLHLGSARTALFNWLYARHTNGKLILRIEDTDKIRSKKEFLDEILDDLKWLGIDWDEKPIFQSKRTSIYKKYASQLLDKRLAYKEGDAIIFKVEKSRNIKLRDIVHGEIDFNTDEIKDQVLIKSDGFPAYNFACAVDDYEMGITHVIRGADHISNTPKQLLFYEALGLNPPKFAHMPLMMGKDGAKLSKRHGAVAIVEYKKEGFLPEALSNYLILLGWSPGKNREIIGLKEAIKLFKIEGLGNVQARFDVDKLRWINGEYIKNKDTKVLTNLLEDRVAKNANRNYLEKVVDLYKTRFRTLDEFTTLTRAFFTDSFPVDTEAREKLEKYLKDDKTKKALAGFKADLEKLENFNEKNIEKICRDVAEKHKVKPAAIIHSTRVAISGKTVGAGLFEMMELLGKKKVLERLEKHL